MQTIKKTIYYLMQGSGALICSLILFTNSIHAQTFIRYSNDEELPSVNLVSKSRTATVNKANFKNFVFLDDDKVSLDHQSLDFSISNDTLYIFDKVKELEEVKIVKEDFSKKDESTLKGNKTGAYADINSNNQIATLIKINNKKKTFIKSIIFFPKDINSPVGKLEIRLLTNKNGLPDHESPILEFEKDFSEITPKRWEIVFPRPILYPQDGLFISFFHHADQKKWNATLRLNADSHMYMFYPKINEWKKMSFNGYYFKLKVLQ